MSRVVLRCRTCGTTQDHLGECDACHEGTVAYFCTNHTPGLWLDGTTCSACGAQYGEAPTPPRGRAAPPASMPARPRVGTAGGGRVSGTVTRDDMPSSSRGRAHVPDRRAEVDDDTDTPSLAELLVDMAEEGRRSRVEPVTVRPTPLDASRRAVPFLGGCVVRLVLLVFFVIVLALLAVFALVGGVVLR